MTYAKLGFGLMRLPRAGKDIDVEQTKRMVDLFMEAGLTYFDTAFVYEGSEDAIAKALVQRYPRESYTLASKLNAWYLAGSEEAAKQQIYTSLERTGAGYFDYYLLHALMESNIAKYDEYGIWEYMQELKAKGLVKHVGLSWHAGAERLDEILTAHPEMEFVQLQINYADWENPEIEARANYEVARKHGLPIIVMEPVKGGNLANPPKGVQRVFEAADPKASFASWAIRYVASLPGVTTVLSGMSNVEQMEDNLSFMREFKPLTDAEQAVIAAAQEALAASAAIPCTACKYCVDGCPMEIDIPGIFAAMNKQFEDGKRLDALRTYAEVTEGGAKASDCIGCGQCEDACPQHLPIITHLETCAEELE